MRIERDIPLAPLTTLKVGGSADYFCAIESSRECAEAVRFAHECHLPFFVLGGGSNVLVSDIGFRGLVIKMDIRGIEADENADVVRARVGAGETWDDFVAWSVERGLYGVENLSGIPGSVGGTPVQNVGAYGADVSSRIDRVETVNASSGEEVVFDTAACRFGYRDSFFKTEEGRKYIITHVVFRLSRIGETNMSYRDVAEYFLRSSTPPTVAEMRVAILAIRARKFPDLSRFGTAGSFFKNPLVPPQQYDALRRRFPAMPAYDSPDGRKKIPAGWLIEHVGGWRGVEKDHVASFANQALVLVNTGGATARSMSAFAETIRKDIAEKTGIVLENEVQRVGDF